MSAAQLTFNKFKPSQESLFKNWFKNDEAGMKFLSSYAKAEDFIHLINFDKRYLWIVSIGDSSEEIGFFDLEIESLDIAYFTFYIAPQFRGGGFGKKLLKEALELLEAKNIKILEGGVEKDNLASVKTLESLGFAYSYTDEDGMLMYQKKMVEAA